MLQMKWNGRLMMHFALWHVIEDGKIVAGGGSPEIELAMKLRVYATTIKEGAACDNSLR